MGVTVSIEARVQGRQLARVARKIMTAAMTLELAADRGDWETVHQMHELLLVLHGEYREQYRGLLRLGTPRV
jgi:hypothetical protein